MKILKRLALIVFLLCVLIGCDQATKKIAERYLASSPPISLMGDMFRFQYAENKGAFLSLGARLPKSASFLVLIVLPLIFLFGLLGYISFHQKIITSQLIGFSFIIGGGFSNLYDRIFNNGYVIDFMNMGIGNIRTGIFNIADVVIMTGFIILVIFSGFDFQDKKRA